MPTTPVIMGYFFFLFFFLFSFFFLCFFGKPGGCMHAYFFVYICFLFFLFFFIFEELLCCCFYICAGNCVIQLQSSSLAPEVLSYLVAWRRSIADRVYYPAIIWRNYIIVSILVINPHMQPPLLIPFGVVFDGRRDYSGGSATRLIIDNINNFLTNKST